MMPAYRDKARGTWAARYSFKDAEGNRHQPFKRGFRTRHDALAWVEADRAARSSPSHLCFRDYACRYLDRLEARESTLITKRNVLEAYAFPFLGSKEIGSIRESDIIAWKKWIRTKRQRNGRPFSGAYLRLISSQIASVLNHAVRSRDIPFNPMQGTGCQAMGERDRTADSIWTLAQYKAFIACVRNDRFRLAFQLAYCCGLREGEVFALRPQDIDLQKSIMRISGSLGVVGGKEVTVSPKGMKGKRIIPIPGFMRDEIKAIEDRTPQLKQDSRLLGRLSRSELHRAAVQGAMDAGVPAISMRGMRHSYVFLLIEEGFTVREIADSIGTGELDVMRRYAPFFQSQERAIPDRLERLFC